MYTLIEAVSLPKLFQEANKKTQYFRYPLSANGYNTCDYCHHTSEYQHGTVRFCLLGGFGIPASYKAICNEFKSKR